MKPICITVGDIAGIGPNHKVSAKNHRTSASYYISSFITFTHS